MNKVFELKVVVDLRTMTHVSPFEINSKFEGRKESDEEKDEQNERTP